MATCQQSIKDVSNIESIPEIYPNTLMPFGITQQSNQLYRLESPNFQTITFTFNITGNVYGMTVSIFRILDSGPAQIASLALNEAVTTFAADFSTGRYIICLRTTSVPQNGTFVGKFVGYPQIPRFNPVFSMGENMSTNLTPAPRPPRPCDEPLFFEIIDGKLPDGLHMDSLGTIRGILPNMDCVPDRLSPGMNWYYTENDDTIWPWGRQYRFKVKVVIANAPDGNFDEDWFCIRIHNNWDFDMAGFLAQSPFEGLEEVTVIEQPEKLPKVMCGPCAEMPDPIPVLRPLPESVCLPCQQPETNPPRVELIEIPVDLCTIEPEDMLTWYLSVKYPSGNPFIDSFIERLRESPSFQLLLSKMEEPGDTDFVALSRYENYLQLAQVRLEPGADPEALTYLMEQWRDYENQVLPITQANHSGEEFSVNLT